MKITRLTKIHGHRIFKDFDWPADLHPFGQFNLIYGWNGCGKTTLSSIFAHLENGSDITEGDVEFEFDEARRCSGAMISTENVGALRVFNRAFIDATITSASEQVGPIYYLGKDSVAKQASLGQYKKKLEKLLKAQTAARQRCLSAEKRLDAFAIREARLIKEALANSSISDYANYNKARFNESIGAMTKEAAIQRRLTDAEKERATQQKNSRPKTAIVGVTVDIADLARISREADALLGRSIASETLSELDAPPDQTAEWVRTGLRIHSGEHATDRCRFCTGNVSMKRRAVIEGHFNDAFASFRSEIDRAISETGRRVLELSSVCFPKPGEVLDHLGAELTTAVSSARQPLSTATTWLAATRGLLERKRDSPFGPLSRATLAARANVPEPNALEDSVAAVNAVIAAHNDAASALGATVTSGCEALEQHFVAEALQEHSALLSDVAKATEDLKNFPDKLAGVRAEIDGLERDVKEHRRPADELNTELAAYLGRDELRFEMRDAGYALKRAGQPVSNLSEGERTAIAFLYFLKSLQDTSFDIEKGTVVIDDPVSSLDANALFSAFGHMQDRTKRCGQLFVLTHNFAFFRQVKNWFHHLPGQKRRLLAKRPARFFMLRAVPGAGSRSTKLGPLDPLLEQYESEYHFLFKRVHVEAHRSDSKATLEESYSMPNIARRLLVTGHVQ